MPGLVEIGSNAFSSTDLGGTLVIPAKVTTIGLYAFANTKLTNLDLSKATSLVQIDTSAFGNVKLDNIKTEFLPPVPCALHAAAGAKRECSCCDFRAGCIAVEPQLSRGSFVVEVEDTASSARYDLKVQRRQLPMTIKKASTLYTLQGVTATPGLIFHWKFPRFFSAELRWLATYVALSRPESLAQLISVGMPRDLRNIIEGGPPEGIISKFDDLFGEI